MCNVTFVFCVHRPMCFSCVCACVCVFLFFFSRGHQQSKPPFLLLPTSLKKAASFTTGPISWFTASHAFFHVLYAKHSIVANGNQE